MTERLQRIHAILRAGHVPCVLSSVPGAGVVLHAGHQDGGVWDVLVHDSDGEVRIEDSRGAVRLPYDSTDTTIGDAVKYHIVQAWADQGNPEARALIALLQGPARNSRASRGPTGRRSTYVARSATAQLLDPLQFAGRMFDAANHLGSIFLISPGSLGLTMWSPWGTVQVGYTRR